MKGFKEAGMKKILKTTFLFFMIVSISASVFAREDLYQSKWIQEKIMMDGSDEDWAKERMQTYDKYGIDYAFKNNGNYMLAIFVFKDPEYLTSVNQSGIMVWLNTEGKKKKRYGIRFRNMRLTADQYIALMEKQQGELTEEQKNDIRVKKFYDIPDMKVTNKDAKSQLKEQVKVRPAAFETQQFDDRIVYEFAIPQERPYDIAPGIGTAPGETIKVGFEWGGMTEEMKEQRLKLASAMDVKARAGAATSDATQERRVGGQMGGLSSMRRSMPKEYNFWVDVKLAEPESTK
jgi:hypothetical protein